MRIDLVLKYLCLVKSRSLAKALCEKDCVLLNGVPARSSTTVRPGDRVTVQFQRRVATVVLDQVPEKQLSKSTALTYYRSVDTPAPERPVDPLDDL